jgi:hypothetical protein
MLFFYCKNDIFIPWKQVEEFMAKYKKKVDVGFVRWEESVHVNHITTHKEEYTTKLRNFVEKCVKRSGVIPRAKL